MPDYMYAMPDTFYSFVQGLANNAHGVWKHNQQRYLSYYANKFPHVLELVAQPNFQTGVYADMELATTVESVAGNGGFITEKNEFFKSLWVYNDMQSSGIKTLIPYSETSMAVAVYNNNYAVANVPARQVEGDWRFNIPRDLVNLAPVSTIDESWASLLSSFNQVNGYQGYIDKVPVAGSLNANKLFQNASRLRSDYLFVRLYYLNNSNFRVATDLINAEKYPSIR
jgi:hypothetical protein